jgi:hypothetical protein
MKKLKVVPAIRTIITYKIQNEKEEVEPEIYIKTGKPTSESNGSKVALRNINDGSVHIYKEISLVYAGEMLFDEIYKPRKKIWRPKIRPHKMVSKK